MDDRLFEHSAVVGEDEAGIRLDSFLVGFPYSGFDEALLPSRTTIQKWIAAGYVSVNGEVKLDKSQVVKLGDEVSITVEIPDQIPIPPPEALDIRIVHQDTHFIVIDKPSGITSHPVPCELTGSVVNFLRYAAIPLPPTSNPLRPGIVHRLDKNTTGLMVIACTDLGYMSLVEMIKHREVHREYLAIVYGKPPKRGTVEAGIMRGTGDRTKMMVGDAPGAKQARTHFKSLENFPGFTLIRCILDTGRTHQIRVHMAHLGYPVVGDPTYGGRRGVKWVENILRWMPKKDPDFLVIDTILHEIEEVVASDKVHLLHAERLSFPHPVTGEPQVFTAEPHEKFRKVLDLLRSIPQKEVPDAV